MSEGQPEGGPKPAATVSQGSPPSTKELMVQVGPDFGPPVSFMCDGILGGNFNPDIVKLVLYEDKPAIGPTRNIQTFRAAVAHLTLRRSRVRTFIKELTDFADKADSFEAKQRADRAAQSAASDQTQGVATGGAE